MSYGKYEFNIKKPFNHTGGGGVVLNATFNNIWVISLQSALLVEETGVHAANHRYVVSN